jgi:hypothetical protein
LQPEPPGWDDGELGGVEGCDDGELGGVEGWDDGELGGVEGDDEELGGTPGPPRAARTELNEAFGW